MFEQQLYTRSNYGGLVHNTPGFDTVAKTDGLLLQELKELEGYCKYEIASELAQDEELEHPPKVKMMLELPNGNVLIGQSVFRMEQRAVFLTHNYICRKGTDSWRDLRHNADDLAGAEAFIETFEDNGEPLALRPLDRLPGSVEGFQSSDMPAPIDPDLLIELIRVTLAAVKKKRKVFIALPGETANLNEAAAHLLKQLYARIPYDLRTKIGHMTFFTGKGVRNAVTLYFVPHLFIPKNKRVQTIQDRHIGNDFVFNYVDSVFINANADQIPGDGPFLKRIRQAGADQAKLADWFEFCEHVLRFAGDEEKTNTETYDWLSLISAFADGETDQIEIRGAVNFLWQIVLRDQAHNYPKQVLLKLLTVYLQRLRRNEMAAANGFIQDLVVYASQESFLYSTCLTLISASVEICGRLGNTALLIEQIQLTETQRSIYADLTQRYFSKSPAVFSAMLNYNFSGCRSFGQLLHSAERLSEVFPDLDLSPEFQPAIERQTRRLTQGDKDFLKELLELNAVYESGKSENSRRAAFELYCSFLNALLHAVHENNVSVDSLKDMEVRSLQEIAHRLDPAAYRKFRILGDVRRIAIGGEVPEEDREPSYDAAHSESAKTEAAHSENVKKYLRTILRGAYFRSGRKSFRALLYAYTRSGKVDYRLLSEHFQENSELLVDFIAWFMKNDQGEFANVRTQRNPGKKTPQLSEARRYEVKRFMDAVISFYSRNWRRLQQDEEVFKVLKNVEKEHAALKPIVQNYRGALYDIKLRHMPLSRRIIAKAIRPLGRMWD